MITLKTLPEIIGGTPSQRKFANSLRETFVAKANSDLEIDEKSYKKRSDHDRDILLRDLKWREEYYTSILHEADQLSSLWWIRHSIIHFPYTVSIAEYFEYVVTDLIADRRSMLLRDGGDHRAYTLVCASEAEEHLEIYQNQGSKLFLRKKLEVLRDRHKLSGPSFPLTQAAYDKFTSDADYALGG